jgi:hypothetical protein
MRSFWLFAPRKPVYSRAFGMSQITDDLLMQGVNVRVNVAMGGSNPDVRFQKLIRWD